MMLKLKGIFSQFSPDLMLFLPITLISMMLKLSWMFFSNNTKWLPSRISYLFKTFFQTVVNTMFQQTKPNTAPWVSSFTAVFTLMFSMKVLGLLPYAFTSTSHMSLTYSIGVPLWMSVKMLGFYLAFNNRLSHLVPQGTPPFLMPLMVMMETLSLFAQPMALGLRLAAKLTAGHLLMFLLSTAMWILSYSPSIAMVTLMMFFLLFLLEVGVACIQAYVFTALMHFYLSQNL